MIQQPYIACACSLRRWIALVPIFATIPQLASCDIRWQNGGDYKKWSVMMSCTICTSDTSWYMQLLPEAPCRLVSILDRADRSCRRSLSWKFGGKSNEKSLLSSVTKVLESLVNKYFSNFLSANNLISPFQSGFRRGDFAPLSSFRLQLATLIAVYNFLVQCYTSCHNDLIRFNQLLLIQPTTNAKWSLNRRDNNSSNDTKRCWWYTILLMVRQIRW